MIFMIMMAMMMMMMMMMMISNETHHRDTMPYPSTKGGKGSIVCHTT